MVVATEWLLFVVLVAVVGGGSTLSNGGCGNSQ
jgi:hypothetical protein